MKTTIKLLLLTGLSLTLQAADPESILSFATLLAGQKNPIRKFNLELKKHPLLVVKCARKDCPPCRVLAPKFVKIAKDYQGKAQFLEIDVQQFSTVVARFRVRSVPTVLIFSRGKLIHTLTGGRIPGSLSVDDLPAVLEELTKKPTL